MHKSELIVKRSTEKIAVVIPCYKARSHVLEVISQIGAECDRVYVVDDCCPESTGDYVAQNCADSHICILRNEVNLGVGGAVMVGYLQAIKDGATV
ncbi:MAG: glycosyltransferase, partial [Desulfomonilaceae bacterium]